MAGSERFEQMVASYRPAILRLCRHHEASADARRDLEQEILVALWRAEPSFRGACSEKTFVLRIAHNVAVTHVVRSSRARQLAPTSIETADVTSAQPDKVAEQRATLGRVELRIRTLDVASQQLVLLALEGCTTAEIAEVTGLTPTNVTTRLSRLRRSLAGPEEGDGESS